MTMAIWQILSPRCNIVRILSFPMPKGATRSALCWHKAAHAVYADTACRGCARNLTSFFSLFWCIPCTIWTVRFCWFFVLIHCRYSIITHASWKVGRRNHSQDDWKQFTWYGKSLQTCTSKTKAPFDDDLCDDGRSVHSPCGGHYMLFPDGPGVFEPHEFEARSVHAVPNAGGAWQSRRRKTISLWVVPSRIMLATCSQLAMNNWVKVQGHARLIE